MSDPDASRAHSRMHELVRERLFGAGAGVGSRPAVGPYLLRRKLGSGGTGVVFAARHKSTGRKVAVKLYAGDAAAQFGSFQREARALEAVRHPHVVEYVGSDVLDNGLAYLAMEWLEGMELRERLAHGLPPLAEALTCCARVAAGLHAAHGHGLVHRDVKPANIFLEGGALQRPKLLDFGLARLGLSFARQTATGQAVGSLCYMAPEQIRGVKELTAAADLFALGAVLFECITGRRAFPGETEPEVIGQITDQPPPRPRDLRPALPLALDDLVASLLDGEPGNRPATALEVSGLLAGLSAGAC